MKNAMAPRVLLGLSVVLTFTLLASAQRTTWPDLNVLSDYPTPGKTCTMIGNGEEGTEKAESNKLKNRYTVPSGTPDVVTIHDLLGYQPQEDGAPPTSRDPRNKKFVSLTGYVRDVKPGGISAGESCNCKARTRDTGDAHIEVVEDLNEFDSEGEGMVVVEVTIRSRILASKGLLSTNIGNDWSTGILRGRLLGRKVRFTGWLFYDADHHTESWAVDPEERVGRANWRGTCWEVHPVMGIEKLD